jgi:hypothetical protein
MIAFGADALLTWLLLSLFFLQKLLSPYSNCVLTGDHGYQRSLRQLRQLGCKQVEQLHLAPSLIDNITY